MLDVCPSFGEALLRRRLEKGWSIRRLARETGIAWRSLYRYEADKRPPKPVCRYALRCALGLDADADGGWWGLEW